MLKVFLQDIRNSIHRGSVSGQGSIFYLANKCHQVMPRNVHLLSSERAALCESGFATGGLAEHSRAACADDDGLCVREDSGDCEASGALDVHEE